MQKNTHTIVARLFSVLLALGWALPASAVNPKAVSPVLKAATAGEIAVPAAQAAGAGAAATSAAVNSAASSAVVKASAAVIKPPVLENEGVAISDGKGKETGRHSIVPSAATVLGSAAINSAQERTITYLREQAQRATTAEYISPLERRRWRAEFESLRALWIKARPSDINDLPKYLTHDVPDKTLAYLQREYLAVEKLIEDTQLEVMPKIVFSYLQNEGRPLMLEEKVYVNRSVAKVRAKVSVLLKALNKDPYLLIQKKYWDGVFGAFNPLLKGVLAKPTAIFRNDNRQFVFSEFALHNPDGSVPYLPESDSMISGESRLKDDDDFDEEQYSGQPEALRRQMERRIAQRAHATQMVQLAEAEREGLLATLPAGLRIAVINDDLLPLLNFQSWGKKGYLGKDASVTTYRDGFSFMQDIQNGRRYDIVITDLVIPDGGVGMMEDFRLLDSDAVVFASSKFYPGDGDDHSAHDLFNFGMDGYIWNNTNLNEGSYGYLQYLRQLNNYYYYKNKNGWQR